MIPGTNSFPTVCSILNLASKINTYGIRLWIILHFISKRNGFGVVKYPNPIILNCPKKNQVLGNLFVRDFTMDSHEKPSWRFQICFIFTPKFGNFRSNFDDHFFLQMGWVGNSTTNYWVIWWKNVTMMCFFMEKLCHPKFAAHPKAGLVGQVDLLPG